MSVFVKSSLSGVMTSLLPYSWVYVSSNPNNKCESQKLQKRFIYFCILFKIFVLDSNQNYWYCVFKHLERHCCFPLFLFIFL